MAHGSDLNSRSLELKQAADHEAADNDLDDRDDNRPRPARGRRSKRLRYLEKNEGKMSPGRGQHRGEAGRVEREDRQPLLSSVTGHSASTACACLWFWCAKVFAILCKAPLVNFPEHVANKKAYQSQVGALSF